MSFPGEEIITKAIEKFSDGILAKMEESEARREREFSFKLKELDYYKSNYDKELKDIFDYWFDVVRITHIKDNENITEQERIKHQKRYRELIKVDKIARYKMNTLKYGGPETGRIFALENKLHQEKYSDKPDSSILYIWCGILAVLKKEILGQDISPSDIIQVLVNDYDKNEKQIEESKKYIINVYKKTYNENPFWAT